MPEDAKAAMKRIAEKLKSAAAEARKVQELADSADASIDQVDKENK
jgi:hypothetical protein